MVFRLLRISPLFFALLAGSSGFFAARAQAPATVYTTANSPLPANGVGALAYDAARARLWVGTEGGLARLDVAAGTWTTYHAASGTLPYDDVRALALGPGGTLWVATFGGLARFDGTTWTRWTQADSPLPSDDVRALAPDPWGGAWVGTASGLVRLDSLGSWHPATGWPLPSTNVSALALGPDGTLWVGAINGGLARRTGGHWAAFSVIASMLPDNTILALALDSLNRPLMGTAAAGLARYLTDSTWARYGPRNSPNPAATVQALAQDSLGRWWLGASERGLVAWDRGAWTGFAYGSRAGLPDSTVRSLAIGVGGDLWIGLRTGGLARWRPGPLGVRSPPAEMGVALWPNPAPAGQPVWLTPPPGSGPGTMGVTDACGRTLWRGRIAESAAEPVGLPPLAPGLYVVRLTWAGRVLVRRLVVE